MIFRQIMTSIGLAPIQRPDDREIDQVMRRARAAAWQHGKLSSNTQSDALDRIEQHVTDTRGVESIESAERLKNIVNTMLGKMHS